MSSPSRVRSRAGQIPDPRDVFGVPFVPSVTMMRGQRAVRRILGQVLRKAALPPLAIQDALAGMHDHRVIGLLVELGIPDHLDPPLTAQDLARKLDLDEEPLERVLRFAAARGFVASRSRGRYGLTGVSRFLRRDHPQSWADNVLRLTSAEFWQRWRDLDLSVGLRADARTEPTGPENDVAGTTIQALALSLNVDWSDVTTVCDVGGGKGTALSILLHAHPHLRATLLDRQPVLDLAARSLPPHVLERTELLEADFTATVPAGFDRYLLMAVMAISDDQKASAVLRATAAAMDGRARLLVVDNLLSPRPTDEFAQRTDLMLLALHGGQERTERQTRDLFERCGLTIAGRHELITGSVAFELLRT